MERPSTPESKWEALPRYIHEEIRRVAQTIDTLDEDGADEAILHLNMFFEQEGVMGLTAKAKPGNAFIAEERISAGGISYTPVLDSEILLKKSLIGTFAGCESFYIKEGECRELAYKLSFQELERNFIATVPISTEQLKFEAPETEEDDEAFVYKAFATLESTGNQQYDALVMLLKTEYEESEDDTAARLRAIGRCAAELINLPIHITNPECMQALHSLLMHSFDDVNYLVTGYDVYEEFNEETASSFLRVGVGESSSQGSLFDIVYISNFAIDSESDADQTLVRMEDGLQPAVRFTLDNNDIVTYPLKHIKHIEAEQEALVDCLDFNNKVRRYLYE